MKFAIKNTKTPEQILKEKVINTQVVYIHTRKDKPGHVFYVGEGKPKRPYSKNRNSYWHNIVKNHGYKVHIIKTNLTVEESLALEVKLTLAYKSIGMAEASIQIGGNGNKIVNNETRLKMSISKKNMSDETRKKLSIVAKNRIVSDETRKKLSIAAKTKPVKAYIGGKIISNFNSINDAAFFIGVVRKNIKDCCNGKQKTSGIYDLENQKFVSLTHAQLKESPNCKRVSWRFI